MPSRARAPRPAALAHRGEDTFISENVEIRRPGIFSIGSHGAVDSGFYCTVKAEIGDYVHIGPHVSVIGGAQGFLKMGHFTNIATGGRVICGTDSYSGDGLIGPPTVPERFRDRLIVEPVVFESFANVGANAVILPGVTLAEGCVIGACALVTRSTEPWTVYMGVPARAVRIRPRERMLRYAREMGY